MKIVWFVHAVASCWNNGNAHFLRGLGLALQDEGHQVVFCEPAQSWSQENLLQDHGEAALQSFDAAFPSLSVLRYDPAQPDLAQLTDGADLVIAHEWNPAALVSGLGKMRARGASFTLLFHDTHHRAVTDPGAMAGLDLSGYDGVLAFGGAIADVYRRRGWANQVWTLHEAADTATFHPQATATERDLVWVGNWGDEERSAELAEYLITPAETLGLRTDIFGVRYPQEIVESLKSRGIRYRGWLANHQAPAEFARSRLTVHVPRRPYARALPGIPTIRVFEALACGIPLISAPWEDAEQLFPEGCYLAARDGAEMTRQMRAVLADADLRDSLVKKGLAVIAQRHTCRHRAAELIKIHASLSSAQEAA
jgi:spore maturation protein CgeB